MEIRRGYVIVIPYEMVFNETEDTRNLNRETTTTKNI